jgi:hypothetical protein
MSATLTFKLFDLREQNFGLLVVNWGRGIEIRAVPPLTTDDMKIPLVKLRSNNIMLIYY